MSTRAQHLAQLAATLEVGDRAKPDGSVLPADTYVKRALLLESAVRKALRAERTISEALDAEVAA